MTRPPVDVVVPFVGNRSDLEEVLARMTRLTLGGADSLLIVDNTAAGLRLEGLSTNGVRIVHAGECQTPGFARNRGAAPGTAPWIVFLDADTAPIPDLLDRYFDPPPRSTTALLAGGLQDEPVPPQASAASRYAFLRNAMTQDDTFSFGEWGYPKSANIACRREAFEAVGGFRGHVRAAEDADLTYRLRSAGWEVERRDAAAVVHFSRRTICALLKQKALWGAGGAWIDRQYPGSIPLARGPGAIRWALLATARGLLSALRRRDRDALLYAVLRPLEAIAFELGRRISNERRC